MTVDHPDMQAAGIAKTPRALSIFVRARATVIALFLFNRAVVILMLRFWRKDMREGDKYTLEYSLELDFTVTGGP